MKTMRHNSSRFSRFSKHCTLAAAMLASAGSLLSAQTQPTAFPLPGYSLGGGWGNLVEAIDLNGDGRKDLVFGLGNTNTIGVAIANNQGWYNPIVQYSLGVEPYSMALADVNNDGRIDIAVADRNAGKIAFALGGVGGTFGAATSYNVGAGIGQVFLADVTGDNKLDILFNIYANPNFRILPGNALGGFLAQTTVSTGTTSLAEIALCDVNGDGKKDLVGSVWSQDFVITKLNTTPGVYGSTITSATTISAHRLASGDINNDGRQDIVLIEVATSEIGYALGQANGSFGATVSVQNTSSRNVRVADVNGDNKQDLLIAHENDGYLSLRIGNGLGGFAPEVKLWGTATTEGCAVVDATGDGINDVVVVGGTTATVCTALANGVFNIPNAFNTAGQYVSEIVPVKLFGSNQDILVADPLVSGKIGVLQNLGNSTLVSAGTWQMGAHITSMAVGDINADGFPDVVTTDESPKTVTIRLGVAAPTLFGAATSFTVPFQPFEVQLADLNSDGALDYLLTNRFDNKVTILFGDGAGGYFAQDFLDVPGSAQRCAIGDFDGDGDRDFAVTLSDTTILPIFKNNGNGTFALSFKTLLGASRYAATGDLNWDGCDELVVSYDSTGISLFSGSPAGLSLVANTNLLSAARRMYISDVNSDGNPDLLAVTDYGALLFRKGQGTTVLGAVETYSTLGYSPQCLAVGDINADGRAEVFVGNNNGVSGTVSVIASQLGAIPGVGSFGFGTPGCRGTHGVLANSAPSVGNANFRLTCTNTPPTSLGLALITSFADTLGSDVFSVGIVNHIQIPFMNNLIWADAYSDLGGNGGAMFPIPSDPILNGATFYGQFIWLWNPGVLCDPSAFNLSSSKGVSLTIQP